MRIILQFLDVAISVRIQKPEILLFGDLKSNNTHIILFQAEIIIESSRYNCLSSIVCTITNVRAKSTSQGTYLRQLPHWLLRPCDVEICKKEELLNHTMDIAVSISPVYIHLSPGIMHTFVDVNIFIKICVMKVLKKKKKKRTNEINLNIDTSR